MSDKITCLHVTAHEFRVHQTRWGNEATYGRNPVVVVRHKKPAFAVIGLKEFEEYLAKNHKYKEIENEYFGDAAPCENES